MRTSGAGPDVGDKVNPEISPGRAAFGSQGRKPLVTRKHRFLSPRRGATLRMPRRSAALPGLRSPSLPLPGACAPGYLSFAAPRLRPTGRPNVITIGSQAEPHGVRHGAGMLRVPSPVRVYGPPRSTTSCRVAWARTAPVNRSESDGMPWAVLARVPSRATHGQGPFRRRDPMAAMTRLSCSRTHSHAPSHAASPREWILMNHWHNPS